MFKRATTVIVDCDEPTREMMRYLLNIDGIDVVGEAASMDDGLALVASLHPDVVVLEDDQRGGITGIDAAPMFSVFGSKVIIFAGTDISSPERLDGVAGVVTKRHPARLETEVRRALQ